MSSRPSRHEQPTPPRPPVSVKGREDGLHVTVEPADPGDVERALRDQLDRRKARFFDGAAVVLELPSAPLDMALASRLAAVIEKAGMQLAAVVSSGWTRDRKRSTPDRGGHGAPTGAAGPDAALVVAGTVRGGQRVAHEGSVLVLGDVNPGGEVIAGGSVVVWGRLRGHVEAGLADGAEGAVVCALDLTPTQLRIGQTLARAPEEGVRTPIPEVARAVEGRIEVEAWR